MSLSRRKYLSVPLSTKPHILLQLCSDISSQPPYWQLQSLQHLYLPFVLLHKDVGRHKHLATVVLSPYNLAEEVERSKFKSVFMKAHQISAKRPLTATKVPSGYNANAGYSLIIDFGKTRP